METVKYPFGQVCRACMCLEQSYHSIFEVAVAGTLKVCEMLATAVPQLIIQAGDEMPSYLCTVCLNKLNIAYNFQQMCMATDKRLHALILSKKSEENPTSSTNIIDYDKLLEPIVLVESRPKRSCIQNESEISINYIEPSMSENSNSFDATSSSDVKEQWSEINNGQITTTFARRRSRSHIVESNKSKAMYNDTGIGEIEKPDSRNKRNSQHPCKDCGKVFDRPYRLRRHIAVHSVDRPYECEICKYRFPKLNSMTIHRLKHFEEENNTSKKSTPANGYECTECPRRFEKSQSLAAHMQAHRRANNSNKQIQQTYECNFCSSSFDNVDLLVQHMQTHSESKEYKCQLCDKTYALEAHLLEHNAKHKGLKHFVCVYCNKSFNQSCTLKEHIRTHTGEKPYLCSICGKTFQSSSNLRQHVHRHSDEKRYHCPECPSKFSCQSDQKKHMSIHTKVKSHVCNTCGATFSRSYTLKKHKFLHTGKRPHKCDQCGMTFVFNEHLRRHLRIHTGEKPYKCRYCTQAYGDSGDLVRHLRKHIGDKTYKCTQCTESFKYHTELRDHLMEHFKSEKEKITSTEISTSVPDVKISEIVKMEIDDIDYEEIDMQNKKTTL